MSTKEQRLEQRLELLEMALLTLVKQVGELTEAMGRQVDSLDALAMAIEQDHSSAHDPEASAPGPGYLGQKR